MAGKFVYTLVGNGKYWTFEPEKLERLELYGIKQAYYILYGHIMDLEFNKKLIFDGLILEDDIKNLQTDLDSVPLDDLLFTQEYLERVITEKTSKEDFNLFKENIEKEYVKLVTEYLQNLVKK